MCEGEGDFVLFRGLDLPHTGFGGRVRVRKRRTVQCPGLTLQISTTRICREVNIIQLLPFDEANTWFYRTDESISTDDEV